MSSSFRLGAIHSLFFSIIYVLVFGSVYLTIKRQIHSRDLEIVRDSATEYLSWYRAGGARMLERRVNDRSTVGGDRLFVRVTDVDSSFAILSRKHDSPRLKAEVLALPESAEGPRLRICGELWAVTSTPLGPSGGEMQVGIDVTAGETTLSHLRSVIILCFFPTMIAGIIGSAFLSYRALHPIREITVTMNRILHTGDLDQRVPPMKNSGEMNRIIQLFNQVLDRNKSLMQAMVDSLDNVAHDFRTPLTRLHMTAERALGEETKPEEHREALVDCLEQSEHLERLLKVLMEISAAEAGAMILMREPFLLGDLVRGVVELYELVAEEKGVEIRSDVREDFSIHADRIRMGQVVANLIDNAVKFTPPGGKVVIKVLAEDDWGTLSISDEGPGIGKEDLPHIWSRLFRAESSRTTPGTGLGLSFVKAIAEAHGGSVGVESIPGHGATFVVRIPLVEVDCRTRGSAEA